MLKLDATLGGSMVVDCDPLLVVGYGFRVVVDPVGAGVGPLF